jgi:hypothetical protein
MYVSKGILRYSPKLIGATNEKWWAILDCNFELGRYYRRLYENEHQKCRRLQTPGWKEHISVVSNEKPLDQYKHLWFKYEGLEVEFNYEYFVKNNDVYFWLEVKCDFLLNLREELGLPRNPEFGLHITIGNNVNL